jgi:hypothetical protein
VSDTDWGYNSSLGSSRYADDVYIILYLRLMTWLSSETFAGTVTDGNMLQLISCDSQSHVDVTCYRTLHLTFLFKMLGASLNPLGLHQEYTVWTCESTRRCRHLLAMCSSYACTACDDELCKKN